MQIADIQPGDIVTTHGGISGRAWPTSKGLIVETREGGVPLLSLSDADLATVKKAPKRRKNAKPLPEADAISDFRPGLDRVIRVGDRCFVVSTDDTWAAIEVAPEPPVEVFIANISKAEAKGWDVTRQFAAVKEYPYMSEQARKERLDALLATGKVRLSFSLVA